MMTADRPTTSVDGEHQRDTRTLRLLLDACVWPSESYWRLFELNVLRTVPMTPPILEIGCGDGAFTELAGLRIDRGIDLNERAVRAARARTEVYRSVDAQDVRQLSGRSEQRFATVFANSVFEHVPGAGQALSSAYEMLLPGGKLVTTVPLARMNRHLIMRGSRYAELRRGLLAHVNLWPEEQWIRTLRAVGFSRVEVVRYLDPSSCRTWDAMDLVGSLGVGRYRVATALRLGARGALPRVIRAKLKDAIAAWLGRHVPGDGAVCSEGCAALLIAVKSRNPY